MYSYPTKITSKNFVKRQIFASFSLLAWPFFSMSAALAADGYSYTENGWSLGVSLSRAVADLNIEALSSELQRANFDVLAVEKDRHSGGYKAYIGYQFTPYLGIEGGYFDLGDFKFLATTNPETVFTVKTDQKGWNLDLVGILPMTDALSALARVGVTRNRNEAGFSSNALLDTTNYQSRDIFTRYKVGFGLQHDLSDALTIRLEAERYLMDNTLATEGETDVYSLGLVYRFGANIAQYSAPAPLPAPVVANQVVTAAVANTEVLVLEDVHFNFDTSALTDTTKVILRQHVQTLKANPAAHVRIAGYTSASGSAAYNQALSERRALAIKAFLILEGIDASRFKTIGFGQTNPAEYEADPSVLRSDAAKANMRGLFEIIVE